MRALLGRVLRLAASLAIAAPTWGCAPARLLNAVITADGYRIERDVAYGEGPRHRLDIYIPDEVAANASVAVFFYGGRWAYGSKADYRFVGQALASRGIVTVVADYRLYPDVRFPGFVEDGAKAVAWVKRHIADHAGDPGRIVLIGHSAGAHIAALLALNPDYLAAEDMKLSDIDGFIGLAGPYDFLPIKDPTVREIFDVDDLNATQPVSHARALAPRTLLLTGDDDATVLPRNSVRLHGAISDHGGDAVLMVYEGIGHVGIILALASPLRWLAPTLDDIVAFIRRANASGRSAA
ncbi:MAG: alpha/beta hydrolase [Rhizobiales bacterium]|nr:alpha/beta hydrolase [Hyphomicrobiales bacterium]